MIKVKPFEKTELNQIEIFNDMVLYYFSILMFLKLINPKHQSESGYFMTPPQNQAVSRIFQYSIMVFSIINFMNLLRDHFWNLNNFLWFNLPYYKATVLYLDSKIKFAKSYSEQKINKGIERGKIKGRRSIRTSRLYFEINHGQKHREQRVKFKQDNPDIKKASFEKSQREFEQSVKFK